LGKKSLKKNKYSVVSPLQEYKLEFLNNINTTNKINFFQKKNFFLTKSLNTNNLTFKHQYIFDTNSIAHINLKTLSGKNAYVVDETILSKFLNVFVGTEFSKKQLFKTNDYKLFVKTPKLENGNSISYNMLNTLKDFDISNKNNINLFLKNDKSNISIQHPDLDDEIRPIKRNSGKNVPIRILKQPKNDMFISNSVDTELFRFRFNNKTATVANKPIKPTVYLTFKQKRYNQRNNIGKKTISFFNNNTKTQQNYSGNPFLKNLSIIEENFGNPTRQYRMIKKAKSRLDTTRVGS
jgi:hypothetical protein